MTRNDDTELNVLPWLAVAALLAAVAALSFAIVALGQSDDNGPAAGSAAMGGMSGDMEHIAPLPIDGIEHARARREGCPLQRVERDGAWSFELEARPVWWQILPEQEVSAYAYNGLVPGPQIRIANGQRVRMSSRARSPDARR